MSLFGEVAEADGWRGGTLRGEHEGGRIATNTGGSNTPTAVAMALARRSFKLSTGLGSLRGLSSWNSQSLRCLSTKGSNIDEAMQRLFDQKPPNRRAIDRFLDEKLEAMNLSNLINFLHLASRKRYAVEEETLGRIHCRIEGVQPKLQDHHIGKAFYAFRTIKLTPNALQLVCTYSKFLDRSQQLSSMTLANAFYFLQFLDPGSSLYHQIFQNLSRLIHQTPDQIMSNSNICSIICGLGKIIDADRRSLLEALVPRIESAQGELHPYEVAEMLQRVSSMDRPPQSLISSVGKKLYSLNAHIRNHHLRTYLLAVREIQSRNNYTYPPALFSHLLVTLADPLDPYNFAMVMSIFQSFTSRQSETRQLLEQLSLHIQHNKTGFDSKCYINGLAGLRYMSSTIPEVERYLNVLYQQMINDKVRYIFSSRDISFMFYGFQTMSNDSRATSCWLEYLTQQMNTTSNSAYDLPSLTRILTGIRLMKSDNYSVRKIFDLVGKQLKPHSLNTTSFVQFASALQGKSTDCPEVSSFLEIFIHKLHSSSIEPISDSNDISKIVSGMGDMNSHLPICRRYIAAVLQRVSPLPSIARADVYTVAMIAYSLRSLDSRYLEVTSLLDVLSIHLAITTHEGMRYGPLNSVDFLNALLGLRRLNSDQPAVQRWLGVIVPLLENVQHKHPLAANQLCSAMASLSHLANDQQMVRRLIVLLHTQLSKSTGNLSTWSFAEAVFGMRRMYEFEDSEDLADELLLELLSKVDQAENLSERSLIRICSQLSYLNTPSSKPFQILVNFLAKKLQSSSLVLSPDGMSVILRGLRGLNSSRASTRNLVESLIPKVSSCQVLSKEEFCLAFSGMERMNSSHECVRRLFDSLLEKCPLNLWDDLTPTEASLLTAGMSSMNPFEFESTNRILIPLSEQRWKIASSSEMKIGEAQRAAIQAIDMMMSRKGIETNQFESQMKILKNIQALLIRGN